MRKHAHKMPSYLIVGRHLHVPMHLVVIHYSRKVDDGMGRVFRVFFCRGHFKNDVGQGPEDFLKLWMIKDYGVRRLAF